MADFSLPSNKLTECRFTLAFSTASTSIGSGLKFNVTETVSPVWRAEIETPIIDRKDATLGEWSAFIAKLRGGVNNFLAHDYFRSTPLAYTSATAPADIGAGWDGTAGVSALTAAGSLTLSGLPANYVVSVGDRIGLEQTVSSVARYGYHEVITGGTANGSGAVTVTVSPFIKTGYFTTSATARLWQPKARFVIDPEYGFDQTLTYGSISFAGIQRL